MKLTGPVYREKRLWFAPTIDPSGQSLAKQLRAIELDAEDAVVQGKILVVNCAKLMTHAAESELIRLVGSVPLRFGAPRLLLLTPEQGRITDKGQELATIWRLYRYSFDPRTDIRVIGSPNRAEDILRRLEAQGRDYTDGFARKEEVA